MLWRFTMDWQKLRKKGFLNAAVTVAVVMMFIIPVSSTFESENTFADTIISIDPFAQIVKKGETFNASIYVVPGKTIMSVDVGVLSFDPSLLQANLVVEGDLFTSYETFTPGIINNTAGTITNIGGNATPPHATIHPGFFCSISFTAQNVFGTSFLDIEDAVVTNTSGCPIIPITVNNGSITIVAWSVMLNFSETSGNNDYVVFGEIHDANDGAPADMYDLPKPPAPNPPYIRAWFDDNLHTPHNFLWEDYRQYPDTHKIWNLYTQWESDSSNSINIMISWNNNEFNSCEYSNITLWRYDPFDVEWDFAADMLTENEYTYMPRYFAPSWLKDHFQIIASDPIPPVISDVVMITSDPLDVDPLYGWESVTCNVTDNVIVNQVKLMITNPDMTTVEYNMTKTGTITYECTITLMQSGECIYCIWADDLGGNNATSTPETFLLPENWEMNDDRFCDISDLRKVALQFGEMGPDGWIRADYNNDGICDISDLRKVALHFGDTY